MYECAKGETSEWADDADAELETLVTDPLGGRPPEETAAHAIVRLGKEGEVNALTCLLRLIGQELAQASFNRGCAHARPGGVADQKLEARLNLAEMNLCVSRERERQLRDDADAYKAQLAARNAGLAACQADLEKARAEEASMRAAADKLVAEARAETETALALAARAQLETRTAKAELARRIATSASLFD